MAAVLLIVAREEPRLYQYVESSFAGVKSVVVVVDRRRQERRRRLDRVSPDRRRQDRRVRDVARKLREIGWAVVRD